VGSVTRGCLAPQRHASHSEAATVQKAKPMDHRLNLLLCFGRIALPQKGTKILPDRARLGAVEIVWNPYVFPLCIVISFTRGCYAGHILASLGPTSAPLTIFASVPFRGSEDFEIIFANANCLQLEYYGSSPELNSRKSNALARVLLPHPQESNQPQ